MPKRVGRYELVAELFTGPLGPVWAGRAAEGAEEGRVVAVRRIPVTAGEAQAQLLTAGAAAMAIRDSKVTAVLDVVPAADEVCVVSEYVDGEPLHLLMKSASNSRSPLPVPVALAVAVDALGAVRALRKRWSDRAGQGEQRLERYLHGGLCPAALVVATFGDTMLTEPLLWGTAASLLGFSARAEMTAYFAPEQLTGEGVADERSDVFSAGVILWELLANRRLFPSGRGRTSSIASLDSVERHGAPVPQAVKQIVTRALDVDPGKRFPAVDALIATLRSLPRDAIASSEQSMVALDRLARGSLEARRALVASVGGRFDSAPPESSRVTAKPPPPKGPVPPAEIPKAPAFSEHEAPTHAIAKAAPRPPPRPPPVKAPPAPPRPPAPAMDVPAPPAEILRIGDMPPPVEPAPMKVAPLLEVPAPPAGIVPVVEAPPPAEIVPAVEAPPAEIVPAVGAPPAEIVPAVGAQPAEIVPVVEAPAPAEIVPAVDDAPPLDAPPLQEPEASTLSVASAEPTGLDARRARARKVAGLAVGGAALLLVVGLVVARKPGSSAGSAASSASQRPAPTPAPMPATRATPEPTSDPVPAESAAKAAPSAEPPPSTEAATTVKPPEVRQQPPERPRPKKKPYRPKGI